MILESGHLYVVPGKETEFETAFREGSFIIRRAKGYISHQLQRCIEVPGKYLLLVEWETLEDHTVGFRGSDDYQEWRTRLHHFYDPRPTIEHFNEVDLGA